MLSEPLSMAFNCFYFFTCFVFLLPPTNTLACCHHRHKNAKFEVLDSYFILFLSPRFLYGMIHVGHVPLLPNFYSKETRPSNLNKVTTHGWLHLADNQYFFRTKKYNRLPFKIKYPNHPLTRFHDVTYHVSPKGHFHVNAYIRPRA